MCMLNVLFEYMLNAHVYTKAIAVANLLVRRMGEVTGHVCKDITSLITTGLFIKSIIYVNKRNHERMFYFTRYTTYKL